MIEQSKEIQYDPREYLLDACYEARALWDKHDYGHGTHNVGRIAMDAALDALNEYDRNVADFERVFGGDFPRLPDGR